MQHVNLLKMLLCLTALIGIKALSFSLPPAILVHGYTGAKIYLQVINKTDYPPELKCLSDQSRHFSWASISALHKNPCEFYNLRPYYNRTTKRFQTTNGVKAEVPIYMDYNSMSVQECLISGWAVVCIKQEWQDTSIGYMMHFTRMLQTTLQYDLGTNLYGVSYDWRFEVTNSELNIYYSNFQRIVEKAHNSTGRKVIIYAHSYGNIFTSWFLHNKVSQEWREKCIDRVVNINAPFGGSMESVFQITTGKPIGIFTKADNYTLLSAKQTRSFARHSPAVASLLPSAEAFGALHVMVSFNGTDYSVKNMDEFLSIIGDEFSSETYHKLVQQEKVTMQRPNINSTCIFGVGIATPKQYIYNSSMDQATMIINGNGDGTVNLNSLIVAKKWAAENSNAQIEVVEINGAEHTAILWNNRFFEIVKQIINFSSPMLQLEKEKQHVVLKNVLLEGDLICVSQLPVWTCEKGYTPLYTAKFTKISMTCFLKNEDNGHHEDEIREAVQAGPFFELNATPNKIYKMRVLESCQHPQKMALLDFIIYYLTIFF